MYIYIYICYIYKEIFNYKFNTYIFFLYVTLKNIIHLLIQLKPKVNNELKFSFKHIFIEKNIIT
jgi:hypothetical protein